MSVRKGLLLAILLLIGGLGACNNASSPNPIFMAPNLESISIAPHPASGFPMNATIQLAVTGHYSDGSTQDLTGVVTWTNFNTSAADVSASGTLTTKADDSQQVFVEASSGSITGSLIAPLNGGKPNDLYIQVYQTLIGPGSNCFTLSATGDLPPDGSADPAEAPAPSPSGAWDLTGVQPKGGYTTWVRAVGKTSGSPYSWVDLSSSVTWDVSDPDGTGTTIDPATRRVTSGPIPGAVYISAVLHPWVKSSPQAGTPNENGKLGVADATLASVAINPGDNTTSGAPQFGPDPIYAAIGHHVPAKVTGTLTGIDAGSYCITWDSVLSSNKTNIATVDNDGTIAGVAMGTATVTARVGSSISDTIPVNVGAPEVDYISIDPANITVPANGSSSVQLTATAYLSDGSAQTVTTDPNTAWAVALGTGVMVNSTGLVTGNNTGSAGDTNEVRACYTSAYVAPDGTAANLVACSNSGDGLQTAPPERDASGNTVNRNAVVTLN